MPGVVDGRPAGSVFDPHFGWETPAQKSARLAAAASSQAIDRARQAESSNTAAIRNAAHDGSGLSMSYTNPTGLAMRYDPGMDGGGAAGSRASGSRVGSGVPGAADRVSLDTLMSDYSKISGPTPPPVTGPPRANRLAANDAAFGAAKAKIGLMNRASINALRNTMGERGISGSGIEAAGTAGIIGAGQHDLAQTVLGQTTADLNREENVEDRDYSGAITQRAQDMQQQQQKRAAIEALFNMRTGGGQAARLY